MKIVDGKIVDETPNVADGTRVFKTGATRDVDDSKLDYEGFLSPFVLERYAQYMHKCRLRNVPPGESMRASDNWQKGIPIPAYMKSLIRHVIDLWKHYDLTNHVDEEMATAVMFNIMGMLHETLKMKRSDLSIGILQTPIKTPIEIASRNCVSISSIES